MPFDIEILSTGSKGNCIIIDGCIMIDCGVNRKLVKTRLHDIDQLFISHQHGDHINMSVMRLFAKERPHLIKEGLHVNRGTYDKIASDDAELADMIKQPNIIDSECVTESTMMPTRRGVYHFETFPLAHDVDNQAFVITNHANETLLHATDTTTLKHVPDMLFDALLVEGNWDETQLLTTLSTGTFSEQFRATRNLRHLSVQSFDRFVSHHAKQSSIVIQLHESSEYGVLSSHTAYDASIINV